jgi:hypothetical protein
MVSSRTAKNNHGKSEGVRMAEKVDHPVKKHEDG